MGKGNPICLCDTKGMEESEWLKMREGQLHGLSCTVGGSTLSSILDISPFTTSKETYDKKCHIQVAIKKEFNEKQKRRGHLFEPYVQALFIDWFFESYGIVLVECHSIEEFNRYPNAIYADTHFYQCGETDENGHLKNPQAVADLDCIIKVNGHIYIVDYKTIGTQGKLKKVIADLRKGIAPEYNVVQVRHYMGVMNVDGGFLVYAWGFSTQEMAVVPIHRDMDIEEELFSIERKFAAAVIGKTGWDTSKCDSILLSNYLTRLHGVVEQDSFPLTLSSRYFSLMMRLHQRKEKREELELQIEEMDRLDAELLNYLDPLIQNHSKIICRQGMDMITLRVKSSISRGKTMSISNDAVAKTAHLDIERLKEERPDIYRKYTVEAFDPRLFLDRDPLLFHTFKLPDEHTGKTNTYETTYIKG